MATVSYIGAAADVSHIVDLTLSGTFVAGNTVTITCGSSSLILTVGAIVTLAGIAEAVIAMVNGDDAIGTETRNQTGAEVPQFSSAIVASEHPTDTAKVRLTSVTAGVPFTLSAVAATGGSIAQATTQQATGKYWVSNVQNWSTGALPSATDTVVIDGSSYYLQYGLTALSGIALAEFRVTAVGGIGLPTQNAAGYLEYLDTALQVSATNINLGNGTDDISAFVRIAAVANTTVRSLKMNSLTLETTAAFTIDLNARESTLYLGRDEVFDSGATPFKCADSTVYLYSLADIAGSASTFNGGEVYSSDCSFGTATFTASAELHAVGSVAATTLNGYEGTIFWNSSGTITNLSLVNSKFDFTGMEDSISVTNISMGNGASVVGNFALIGSPVWSMVATGTHQSVSLVAV